MTAAEPPERAPRVPRDPTLEKLAERSPEERELLLKVAGILERLQFGTILLVVQDGKVVQIEMAEKFRLR